MSLPAKSRTRKIIVITTLLLAVCFIFIQFIQRPSIPNDAVTGDLKAPAQVKEILKRACYDCHSNETNLRWYDQIAPAYWEVAQHVKQGRKVMNFSTWDSLAPGDQKAKLWEAINQITAGAMPVKSYTLVHPAAKVSVADIAVLKKYLLTLAPPQKPDTAKVNAADRQYASWQKAVAPVNAPPKALNGIEYIPDYKNWQVVSTTDRIDNGTMRVIFGNDIAIKAIREKHNNPWPDGTILAKVAWDKLTDKDGNVHTGEFKQVEYMIKDAKKYAATKGWGFARFKTPKMLPYGKTALFATECINCHRPEKDHDYVFTKPVKF